MSIWVPPWIVIGVFVRFLWRVKYIPSSLKRTTHSPGQARLVVAQGWHSSLAASAYPGNGRTNLRRGDAGLALTPVWYRGFAAGCAEASSACQRLGFSDGANQITEYFLPLFFPENRSFGVWGGHSGPHLPTGAAKAAIHLSETKYSSVGAMIAKTAKIEVTFEILPDGDAGTTSEANS